MSTGFPGKRFEPISVPAFDSDGFCIGWKNSASSRFFASSRILRLNAAAIFAECTPSFC